MRPGEPEKVHRSPCGVVPRSCAPSVAIQTASVTGFKPPRNRLRDPTIPILERMHGASPGTASTALSSPAASQESKPRLVAIIGAGFSGISMAIHLLRQAQGALRIAIIDPREEIGAGVAYATRDYPY